jgi:hypothetical protein
MREGYWPGAEPPPRPLPWHGRWYRPAGVGDGRPVISVRSRTRRVAGGSPEGAAVTRLLARALWSGQLPRSRRRAVGPAVVREEPGAQPGRAAQRRQHRESVRPQNPDREPYAEAPAQPDDDREHRTG